MIKWPLVGVLLLCFAIQENHGWALLSPELFVEEDVPRRLYAVTNNYSMPVDVYLHPLLPTNFLRAEHEGEEPTRGPEYMYPLSVEYGPFDVGSMIRVQPNETIFTVISNECQTYTVNTPGVYNFYYQGFNQSELQKEVLRDFIDLTSAQDLKFVALTPFFISEEELPSFTSIKYYTNAMKASIPITTIGILADTPRSPIKVSTTEQSHTFDEIASRRL